ncbi:MAG: Transcriptional regulator, LacI family [Devosia sp.]|jgi:LacI family transcriptional regulator|nr:Transcriptional regulator, LacI family [Devosia sp.]
MARVTLSTIAQHMGISKFAVSRALSGKDGVSEATRQRVQQVADELGYERGGSDSGVPALGIVFHDTDLVNSELHLLVQSGFHTEAQKYGYQVRMASTHLLEEVEEFASQCQGVALVGPHSLESMTRIKELGIPLARNGWVDPLAPFDLVSGTDHEGGAAVANYLIELGHRNIAYVHGTPGYRGRTERFYGMREVLEAREDVRFREIKFHSEKRFTAHLKEAKADGFEPTAFFCAHDGMALTVVTELLTLGYRIPEDVSVVGFGDYSAATQITPHLTTVRVHGRQIGAGLVRVLDDRIKRRIAPDVAVRISFAAHLVVRESAGKARVRGAERLAVE